MRATFTFLAVVAWISVLGCDSGPKSSKGFTLPDGDTAQGKVEFLAFRCFDCHSVAGVELPGQGESEQTLVALGGEVSRIKTYGELVTSVINPSHRLAKGFVPKGTAEEGKSTMTTYNDAMTVRQLIDLVAFLQSHYELREYEPTHYPPYGY
jgi:sulfur-oxidizing protein SoxX